MPTFNIRNQMGNEPDPESTSAVVQVPPRAGLVFLRNIRSEVALPGVLLGTEWSSPGGVWSNIGDVTQYWGEPAASTEAEVVRLKKRGYIGIYREDVTENGERVLSRMEKIAKALAKADDENPVYVPRPETVPGTDMASIRTRAQTARDAKEVAQEMGRKRQTKIRAALAQKTPSEPVARKGAAPVPRGDNKALPGTRVTRGNRPRVRPDNGKTAEELLAGGVPTLEVAPPEPVDVKPDAEVVVVPAGEPEQGGLTGLTRIERVRGAVDIRDTALANIERRRDEERQQDSLDELMENETA